MSQVVQVVVGVASIKTRPAIMIGMLCMEGAKRIKQNQNNEKH